MRLITSCEARELDRQAQELGVSGLALMEAAACKAAAVALRMLSDSPRKGQALILAGRGNNGGDGLALARHLRNAGIAVRVYLCGHQDGLPPEAAANLGAWMRSGGHCAFAAVPQSSFWDDLQRDLAGWAGLVVDAMLGIGQTRPPGGEVGRAVSILSAHAAAPTTPEVPPVLSLDVPTGVDADTGQVFDPHVQAGATVTFGLPKLGLLTLPGAVAAGRVFVADIGLPGVDREAPPLAGQAGLFAAAQAAPLLPPRPRAAHKGDAGTVLLIGGSTGMTGAAMLMAQSAVRGGAGLVTLAVPAAVQPVVASGLREAMTFALPSEGAGGRSDHGVGGAGSAAALGPAALDAALRLAAGCDAAAIGPGMGRDEGVAEFIRCFVGACPVPLVLDADGINAFAGRAQSLAARASCASLLITPHPGELSRLLGVPVAQIQADRMAAARRAARAVGGACLLKGPGTVAAAADGTAWMVSAGNPGMASGGMGDVLTGLLAALWAQRPDPHAAHSIGAVGALLHAVAGDLAALEIGQVGLRAGDVAGRLPRARHLLLFPADAPAALKPSLLGVAGIV